MKIAIAPRVLLFAALPLLACSARADQPKLIAIDVRDPGGEKNRLLLSYESGGSREFLCEYVRSAAVVFSGGGTRLAVNEHTASSGGDEIRIFRQVAGLRFEEIVGDPPLSNWLLDMVKEKLGITRYPDEFGCDATGWTAGPNPSCLIEVRATLGGKDYVWRTAFSPESGKMASLSKD